MMVNKDSETVSQMSDAGLIEKIASKEDSVVRVMAVLNAAAKDAEFVVTPYQRLNVTKSNDWFKNLRVVFDKNLEKKIMPLSIFVVSSPEELVGFLTIYCGFYKEHLDKIRQNSQERTFRHVMKLLKEHRIMVINADATPTEIENRFRTLLTFYNKHGGSCEDLLIEEAVDQHLLSQRTIL